MAVVTPHRGSDYVPSLPQGVPGNPGLVGLQVPEASPPCQGSMVLGLTSLLHLPFLPVARTGLTSEPSPIAAPAQALDHRVF